MSEQPTAAGGPGPAGDNHTLPAWVYNDARFFELERTTPSPPAGISAAM